MIFSHRLAMVIQTGISRLRHLAVLAALFCLSALPVAQSQGEDRLSFEATLKAAPQGNAQTQYNLEELERLQVAARQHDAEAQFKLGLIYKEVFENPQKATEWFDLACQNGDRDACDWKTK